MAAATVSLGTLTPFRLALTLYVPPWAYPLKVSYRLRLHPAALITVRMSSVFGMNFMFSAKYLHKVTGF